MNSARTLHTVSARTAPAFVVLLLISTSDLGCQSEAPNDAAILGNAYHIVDLTHSFNSTTIFWPTEVDGFVMEEVFRGMTEGGYYYEANRFRTAEHGGTHLDAPVHFAEGKHSVETVPLDQLIGSAVVIDVSERASQNADYRISTEDVLAWENLHGQVSPGAIVLFKTGYAAFWSDRSRYLGTDLVGPDAIPNLHFPGIAPDLARWLTTERDVSSVGIDTPSIDNGQSTDFMTHRILFAENIPAFENVANLDVLPSTGAVVIALPMKIEGGSGGPLRIVALVPSN